MTMSTARCCLGRWWTALLYGSASFGQHALMLTGTITLPDGLGRTAARWHLLLWDLWWIVGGVLFVATAWLTGRASAHSHRG